MKFSADDILIFFSSKKALAFLANCLLSRQFARNAKVCILGQKDDEEEEIINLSFAVQRVENVNDPISLSYFFVFAKFMFTLPLNVFSSV